MLSLNVIREPDQFCKPCGLYKLCKTPVMNGEGSKNPTWLFIGEAPGAEEDEDGTPFVGESGSELRQAIEDVGIPLNKCRFTNVVRCRPPGNNLGKYPDAIKHCRPHILREIRATNPKVVVLIGNSAIKSILSRTGILSLHGQVIDIGRLKFVCMFHPAYLLRNNKPKVRRDFLDALRVAKRAASSKSIGVKSDRKCVTILDKKMLYEAVDVIKKSEYPATDIEASTLSPFSKRRESRVGVVGIAPENDLAYCFPVNMQVPIPGLKLKPEESLEAIKEVWEDENLNWIAWHAKYDMGYMIVKHGIWLGGKGHRTGAYYDGMLGSYALDERQGVHSLKDWDHRVKMSAYDQGLQQYKMVHPEIQGDYTTIPSEVLFPYNADDCMATRRAFFLQRKLLKEQGLWKRPVMFPLMPIGWILMMMEIVGMKADLDRNAELDKLYVKRVEQLDSRLHNYAAVKQLQKEADREILERAFEHVKAYKKPPKNFKKKVFEIYHKNSKPVNLNSPDERRKLIFNILNYEVLKYTKIGKVRLANEDIPDEERWQLASTERWIIEELAKKHKSKLLVDMIKRGEYSSAHSKYILPLEPRWVGTDGRVHSNHLPHGTKTGRPSSQDPNLYNLPARSSLTPELMSQFVPRNKHYVIVRQDSKQIELRLIADRAQDKTMIAEFNAGKDPHRMAAQAAYGYTEEEWAELPEELQKALRSNAKNAVSFGLVYGREAEALAVDFGWKVSKAEDFKSKYFGKYYGIKEYLEEETERIREACLSISHYNRHRRLPEAQSEDIGKANHAIREGINAPIQGDASDINIVAAYRMQRWCMKHEMKTRVINFVYDAVYLDAYRKELPVVVPKLHFFMTDRDFLYKMAGWKLRVPLDTDCEIGEKNMGAMTGLEHTKVPGQFVIPKAFLKN